MKRRYRFIGRTMGYDRKWYYIWSFLGGDGQYRRCSVSVDDFWKVP